MEMKMELGDNVGQPRKINSEMLTELPTPRANPENASTNAQDDRLGQKLNTHVAGAGADVHSNSNFSGTL